ncbi:unnamed protein product [Leuciscus chuanchicus]
MPRQEHTLTSEELTTPAHQHKAVERGILACRQKHHSYAVLVHNCQCFKHTTGVSLLAQREKVIVGGDMRADSPGHSAKYGSYTMIDLETNTVVDVQLVQSNEVGGSYHMEKEGLKRGLDFLDARGVTLDCVVTDRHPQIQKFLRERNVNQFYDVWHIEKGISKQLEKVCKLKGCEKIHKWLYSINNHIFWTAASSSRTLPYFKLERVLSNKRILKDVAKLSPHFQTSSIKVFHSVILRFTPKNVVFPFLGMLCRLYLAALHYNENAGRPQATTAAGRPVFKVTFPKAKKGEYRVREVKTQATFRYVDDLLDLIFDKVFVDPAPYVDDVLRIPIPPALCAEYDRPEKEEAISSRDCGEQDEAEGRGRAARGRWRDYSDLRHLRDAPVTYLSRRSGSIKEERRQ